MASPAIITISFHLTLAIFLLITGSGCSGPSSSIRIDGNYYVEAESLRRESFFSEAEKEQMATLPAFTLKDGYVQFTLGFEGSYQVDNKEVQMALVEKYKTSLFDNLSKVENGKIYLLFRIEDDGDLTWLRNDGSSAMRFEKR